MHPPLPAVLHLAAASVAPVIQAPLASAFHAPSSIAVLGSAFLAPQAAAPLASAAALLRQLAQASLMGTLFVLTVWLLCRLAPRLPASLRCALWWLACLKLLLGLAWPAPLALPLLPPAAAAAMGWLALPEAPAHATAGIPVLRAPATAPVQATRFPGTVFNGTSRTAPPPLARRPSGVIPAAAGPRPAVADPRHVATARPPAVAAPRSAAAARPPAAPWWALGLIGLWVGGVLRQVAGTARELRRVRGFLARSAPVCDAAVLRLAADLGRALGLAPVAVRAAPSWAGLTAPLTAGALHPVVVLPAAGLESLSRQELAMTLAHELVHVRRRDLLWGWIPAAAARLFFFLPPAALAAREYGLAREAACDAAVLRLLGATPASYGSLLLRLGVRSPSGPRTTRLADLAAASAGAATVGGAAASLQQLKRRLEMLQHHPQDVPPRPARLRRAGFSLLALLAVAALLPLRLVTPPVPPPTRQPPHRQRRPAIPRRS